MRVDTLITFTGSVSIRSRLTSDLSVVRRAFDFDPSPGNTALIDAVHAAMVVSEGGAAQGDAGRPLVIVFSDGADTASFLTPRAALETASRSGAVVYAVRTPASGKGRFLDEVVRATGGDRIDIEAPGRFSDALVGVLDAFRHRYLLSYAPQGVPSAGWHELVVRVKDRRAEVRARPGYWAEE